MIDTVVRLSNGAAWLVEGVRSPKSLVDAINAGREVTARPLNVPYEASHERHILFNKDHVMSVEQAQ
jgi:hypothetical protein